MSNNVMATEDAEWANPDITERLLGRTKAGQEVQLTSDYWKPSLYSLGKLRERMHRAFIGADYPDIIDWLLATIIGRENALLLGAPGVAKSQIATHLLQSLDLQVPPKPDAANLGLLHHQDPWDQWKKRVATERKVQKYFHYLISRFTQPEELFGPVEISLLRQGLLVRVNFGLLTGAGVRAAFLDEVFNASSNILNTLLTLTQERRYFNWGGMEESDLLFLIGASNDLPGAFGGGVARGHEDFQQTYAFLDRFPLRLLVPGASGGNVLEPEQSELAKAFDVALRREVRQFSEGTPFAAREPDLPCVNDIVCLGRAMLEAQAQEGGDLFAMKDLARFRSRFIHLACALQQRGTDVETGRLTWTISPRKLRALYKIALGHALVQASSRTSQLGRVPVGAEQLRVFEAIWDQPAARDELRSSVGQATRQWQ